MRPAWRVEDRRPGYAGTLDGHMGTPLLDSPSAKRNPSSGMGNTCGVPSGPARAGTPPRSWRVRRGPSNTQTKSPSRAPLGHGVRPWLQKKSARRAHPDGGNRGGAATSSQVPRTHGLAAPRVLDLRRRGLPQWTPSSRSGPVFMEGGEAPLHDRSRWGCQAPPIAGATEERSNCLDCQEGLVCYARGTSCTFHGFLCLSADGMENRQELTHAGCQRHLLGFTRGAQALGKGFKDRIIADGSLDISFVPYAARGRAYSGSS